MASRFSVGRPARVPWISATIVLLIGLLTTAAATQVVIANERTAAERNAERAGSQIALQLETVAVPTASITHALEAYVMGQAGSLDPVNTQGFMDELLDAGLFVRSLSIAPGNRIEYIAPLAGNEAALGLDFSTVPDQWAPIEAIIASGKPALVGPFEMVQGGVGLAYRRPITLPENGYWGLASSVIDAEAYFAEAISGVDVDPDTIGIRNQGTDDDTAFWGSADAFRPGAVITQARPLGTAWEVAVVPAAIGTSSAAAVGLVGITTSILLAWVTLTVLRLRQRRRDIADRLARLSSQTPGMLYQVRVHPDGSSTLEYASDCLESIFGVTGAQIAAQPGVMWSRVDPADLPRIQSELRRSVAGSIPWHVRMRMAVADGTMRWFQTDATVEAQGNGDSVVHGYLVDITEEVAGEERLRISASVFSSTRDGVILMDPAGCIIDVNAGFTELLGFELSEVQGHRFESLSSGATTPDIYSELWSTLESTGSWQGELIHRRQDGEITAQAVTITSVLDGMGGLSHYVAVVSAMNSMQADLVTGLPNRLMADDRLAQEVDRARIDHSQLGLIVVSLDRFRDVNEVLGHRAGDVVLKEVAARLRAVVPAPQTVARLGGDEFAVILSDEVTPEAVIGTASALADAVRVPIRVGTRDVRVSASLGIALFPSDASSAVNLLTAASQAVRESSASGGGRITFVTKQMQESSRERVRITDALHSALARGEMSMVLQPVVDLATGRTAEAEALIRWHHPELGLIIPERFIPLAEASGQIAALGDWMFGQVLDAVQRAREIHPEFRISFNLSPGEIHNSGDRHQQRMTVMRQRDIPGDALIAEITEGVLLTRGSDSERHLRIYRDAGIELAIDDFGTQYSSLSYLQSLDLAFLKIDRSFVQNMSPGNESHALCVAIITMAHALDLRVIAEGVETELQRDLLTQAECDLAQGYLFAKPLPPDDLWERLRGERET